MGEYSKLMKAKVISDFYSRLSEEDKAVFAQMFYNNPDGNVLSKLDEIERKVDGNRYSFRTDLGANILGNVITDSAIFIIKKLIGR